MSDTKSHTKTAFWRGFREGLPFILIVAPFGILFGVVGTEAGLNILQVMSFAVLVIAGAAQFSAVTLLADNAPTIIVLITALAVNLRMAMYSAALVPHFGKVRTQLKMVISFFIIDQAYALAEKEFTENPELPLEHKISYFFGIILALAPFWYITTYIGAVLGSSIPDSFSLDYAVPICFIALVAPLLKTLPHVIAAITSIICALSLAWIPYSLGLIIAGIIAMMVGAYAELKLEARK